MSFHFARQTIKMLLRDYGTPKKITLTRYKIGSVNFQSASPANSVEHKIVTGIALPDNINAVFFAKSILPYDKKSRPFVISTVNCPADWVKEGNYLTYMGIRYNIKWSDALEGIYYYVIATADGDEPNDP